MTTVLFGSFAVRRGSLESAALSREIISEVRRAACRLRDAALRALPRVDDGQARIGAHSMAPSARSGPLLTCAPCSTSRAIVLAAGLLPPRRAWPEVSPIQALGSRRSTGPTTSSAPSPGTAHRVETRPGWSMSARLLEGRAAGPRGPASRHLLRSATVCWPTAGACLQAGVCPGYGRVP